MSEPAAGSHPLVPPLFLAGFADATGQLMAERRDRTRRRFVAVGAVVAELGAYSLPAGPRALETLLAEAEARAVHAVGDMIDGRFPPASAERASLALVLALQLVLGRHHRATAQRVAGLVGQVIASTIAEAEAARAEEAEPDDAPEIVAEATPPESGPTAAVEIVSGSARRPVRQSLEHLPALARQIAARTWQLVRFPGRVLLTSDSPVVLWAPSATAKPFQVGLGGADELRVPLDPRHALIVARHARAGEVVRDLDDRHARALNRTVAESAAEWMYYHPESDPLEGVELPSPEPE